MAHALSACEKNSALVEGTTPWYMVLQENTSDDNSMAAAWRFTGKHRRIARVPLKGGVRGGGGGGRCLPPPPPGPEVWRGQRAEKTSVA